jgi:hypothetical protein
MQDTVKRKIINILVVLFVIFSLPIVWLFAPRHKQGEIIRIDCTWSEISPDFSTAMKEACRKARIVNPT